MGLLMAKVYNPFLDILPSIDVHGYNRDMIKYTLDIFIKDKVNQLCEKFGYKPLNIGCMIEIPAAVFDLTRIIQEVDFINIGTNDLTKFTFATERECPVYDNKILEKVLDYIIGVAKEYEKPYYICGELYKERN